MKKLKNKMIVLVVISSVLVFFLTILGVYSTLRLYYEQHADSITSIIAVNNGVFPKYEDYEKFNPSDKKAILRLDDDSFYRTRYFVVYLNEDDGFGEVDTNHIAKIDNATALKMAYEAFELGETTGYVDNFRFRFSHNGSKDMLIFIDCTENTISIRVIVLIMSFISFVFSALITLLFAIFSKRILRPFEENNRRQKQFITDASHELKTPLAIISANAEVLKYKYEENEWTENITNQIQYMAKLINELLVLTRMEESGGEVAIEEVNFSELAKSTTAGFDEVFLSKNVTIEKNIAENVVHNANRGQIERLMSILTENASKYVTENGRVEITLESSHRYTTFSVFNTAEIEKDFDTSRLFDRFYRPDNSRTSSTGGHGIGLSIAKKITSLHNGKINAIVNDEGICFRAEFSNHLKKTKIKDS